MTGLQLETDFLNIHFVLCGVCTAKEAPGISFTLMTDSCKNGFYIVVFRRSIFSLDWKMNNCFESCSWLPDGPDPMNSFCYYQCRVGHIWYAKDFIVSSENLHYIYLFFRCHSISNLWSLHYSDCSLIARESY